MLRYVVLAVTLMVGMAAWPAAAQDEAADQGDQTGQFVLGVMFFSGKGVPQNGEESLKWLQASARQGYSPAQEFLRERGQNW